MKPHFAPVQGPRTHRFAGGWQLFAVLVASRLLSGCFIDREVRPVPRSADAGLDGALADAALEGGLDGAMGADTGPVIDSDAGDDSDAGLEDGGVIPPGLRSCTDFRARVGQCPPQCSSCDRGLCRIDCDGTAACSFTTLACPEGFACFASCGGLTACAGLELECADGPCEVSCTGPSSCVDLRLSCGQDACRLLCAGGAGDGATAQPGQSCDPALTCG